MFASVRGLPAALVFVVSIILAGCVQAPYKAMDPVIKANLGSSQAVVLVPQQELYAEIPKSGGGGGIIGALIQAGMDKKHTKVAEQGVAPLRNDLLDLDFDRLVLGDLKTSVAGMDWLHADKVILSKDATADGQIKLVTDATEPYTLMLYTNYHLTPDFHALIVSVTAVLLPKTSNNVSDSGQKLSAINIKNAVTVQTVIYRKNIPDEVLDATPLPPKPPVQTGPDGRPLPSDKAELDDDQQQAVIVWGRNGSQMLKDALTEAAAVTSRLMALSLGTTPSVPAGAAAAKVDDYGHGVVLEPGIARVVVLLNDHRVISSDAADVDLSPAQPSH